MAKGINLDDLPSEAKDRVARQLKVSRTKFAGEDIMRLAAEVVSHLGGSGYGLPTQREALRLALAWLDKGPSFAKECSRKKPRRRQ